MGLMMNTVEGKIALVTGGGSGIGEASSELLAEGGASIIVTDMNAGSAEQTANVINQRGGTAMAMQQDVTEEGQWKSVLDTVKKEFGRLDILVNNAGISGAGEDNIEEGSFSGWRKVMAVNLDGVYLGCRSAIEAMKEEGGSIINISSVMGMVGGAGPAYNASKGGVRLLTKSLAVYCGNMGYPVRVNSVHPGYIWTPMVREISEVMEDVDSEEELYEMLVALHPIGRLGEAEDIARGVRFLASDESSFMTGSELVIDGGYTAM